MQHFDAMQDFEKQNRIADIRNLFTPHRKPLQVHMKLRTGREMEEYERTRFN